MEEEAEDLRSNSACEPGFALICSHSRRNLDSEGIRSSDSERIQAAYQNGQLYVSCWHFKIDDAYRFSSCQDSNSDLLLRDLARICCFTEHRSDPSIGHIVISQSNYIRFSICNLVNTVNMIVSFFGVKIEQVVTLAEYCRVRSNPL